MSVRYISTHSVVSAIFRQDTTQNVTQYCAGMRIQEHIMLHFLPAYFPSSTLLQNTYSCKYRTQIGIINIIHKMNLNKYAIM